METALLIVLTLLLLSLALLAWALKKEKLTSEKLRGQLRSINRTTEAELFDRGKYCELGMMSAGITHEISNPLTVIIGRVTQLLRRETAPELRSDLESVKASAERIAMIVQRVREYIYEDMESTEDFISLKEVLDDVLTFYGQRIRNHGIELRLKNIDKVYLSGNKGKLEQVFLNLISNAFDAVDKLPEKWIEVSAVLSGDDVEIYVRDSGTGIPREIREKMLDPFFTTKRAKGTGLGLPLVRDIVEKHGGDFKYVEAPHTTFEVRLPKASSLHYHH